MPVGSVGTLQVFFEYFRNDFHNFFSQKYKEESFRNAIFNDLVNFVRNEMVKNITFAILDPIEDIIVNGYIYNFDYESIRNVEKVPDMLQDSPATDVLLIIDFNEEWNKKDNDEKENIMLNLTMHWNFLPEMGEISTKEDSLFFQYDKYKINRNKIEKMKSI